MCAHVQGQQRYLVLSYHRTYMHAMYIWVRMCIWLAGSCGYDRAYVRTRYAIRDAIWCNNIRRSDDTMRYFLHIYICDLHMRVDMHAAMQYQLGQCIHVQYIHIIQTVMIIWHAIYAMHYYMRYTSHVRCEAYSVVDLRQRWTRSSSTQIICYTMIWHMILYIQYICCPLSLI